ncbi:MAG: DUF4926 domain-containing protein [Caldilineaceae bacterium]|nr:DUF4926 domain-containing protein [Caldilineaceae bacterium]
MTRTIQMFDVVALTQDIADAGLSRGQVGTALKNSHRRSDC